MLSYLNSLSVCVAFKLGAFWGVPLLIQPRKSVGGHPLRALPRLILLTPLPGLSWHDKTQAGLIHYCLDATIRTVSGPFAYPVQSYSLEFSAAEPQSG